MGDAREAVHVALSANAADAALVEQRLRARDLRVVWLADATELSTKLPDIRYLLIGRPPRLDWSRATQLALLQVAGTGVDPLFPAIGLPPNVQIANTRGAHVLGIRDHVLALLLTFVRELPRFSQQQARREWRPRAVPSVAGHRLCLVGFGSIGQSVARAASALGMSIDVVRRSSREAPPHDVDRVFAPEHLEQALHRADSAVVCLPLTSQTRGLLSARTLNALRPHAVLIDVSRGGIVDQAALEALLRRGALRAAALDVFEHEPLDPQSSLWSCPNLVLTPHVAGFTPDYLDAVLDVFLKNIDLVAAGASPCTPVSRELEY